MEQVLEPRPGLLHEHADQRRVGPAEPRLQDLPGEGLHRAVRALVPHQGLNAPPPGEVLKAGPSPGRRLARDQEDGGPEPGGGERGAYSGRSSANDQDIRFQGV